MNALEIANKLHLYGNGDEFQRPVEEAEECIRTLLAENEKSDRDFQAAWKYGSEVNTKLQQANARIVELEKELQFEKYNLLKIKSEFPHMFRE